MRKLVKKAIGTVLKLQYSSKLKNAPRTYLIKNIPYFSQWESPELVESILTNKTDASNDPNWKSSGAKTKQEYSLWSANGCGMACTKMILANESGKIIPIVELGEKSAEYGTYTLPLETSVGQLSVEFRHYQCRLRAS
jgi:hypothetical protein